MKTDHLEERRKFISDAFHTLNQPLTGLHCGLEIALQRPRSEGEYRQRIGDGLENAGAILQLVRAVRQLVDAADPGERFGTVEVPVLLSQLKSELEVVAEATRVGVTIEESVDVKVSADPGKLLAALGGLVAGELGSYEAGGSVRIATVARKKWLELTLSSKGTKKAAPIPVEASEKLAEIRRNAACCYVWTLGGDLETVRDGWKIKLPTVPA